MHRECCHRIRRALDERHTRCDLRAQPILLHVIRVLNSRDLAALPVGFDDGPIPGLSPARLAHLARWRDGDLRTKEKDAVATLRHVVRERLVAGSAHKGRHRAAPLIIHQLQQAPFLTTGVVRIIELADGRAPGIHAVCRQGQARALEHSSGRQCPGEASVKCFEDGTPNAGRPPQPRESQLLGRGIAGNLRLPPLHGNAHPSRGVAHAHDSGRRLLFRHGLHIHGLHNGPSRRVRVLRVQHVLGDLGAYT
mmetsp:Transcript_77275/g.165676  ORF Transcript_77275/g.165676 Transcript_77275/m.165676 type:complete len:251 (+) Transcript_77275:266-1018(+)